MDFKGPLPLCPQPQHQALLLDAHRQGGGRQPAHLWLQLMLLLAGVAAGVCDCLLELQQVCAVETAH